MGGLPSAHVREEDGVADEEEKADAADDAPALEDGRAEEPGECAVEEDVTAMLVPADEDAGDDVGDDAAPDEGPDVVVDAGVDVAVDVGGGALLPAVAWEEATADVPVLLPDDVTATAPHESPSPHGSAHTPVVPQTRPWRQSASDVQRNVTRSHPSSAAANATPHARSCLRRRITPSS